MAWVRTAPSLITFGSTIYKYFQIERIAEHARISEVIGPRGFASIMIAIGLFALVLAILEHRQDRRILLAQYGTLRRSLAGIVAGLISVLGLVALAAVILRV